jgi:predicted secreted hydrolase
VRRIALAGLFAALSVGLLAQTSGWTSAKPGRSVVLPADHASHPEYQLEWWYYTGNLIAEGGRRFGYQLTFFRVGMDAAPKNPSRWAVRDLVMTHVALTDVQGRRFHTSDRMNRPGPGWAGAATDRYRVWNEDWSVELTRPGLHALRASFATDSRISADSRQATGQKFGIELDLVEDRAPVLHGDRGYSRKGASPGNASFYYSLTRMPTSGAVLLDGRRIPVTGFSWMDHEFGTNFLEQDQAGWDWLSIQLDDGGDVMLFQLRRTDGTIDLHSSGTLVEPGGRVRAIATPSAFSMTPGRRWRSPASGAAYPVQWTVRVPGAALELTLAAVLDDQELRTAASTGVTYWEGAIDVRGTRAGRPVTGRGYLEMTGYAGRALGQVMR